MHRNGAPIENSNDRYACLEGLPQKGHKAKSRSSFHWIPPSTCNTSSCMDDEAVTMEEVYFVVYILWVGKENCQANRFQQKESLYQDESEFRSSPMAISSDYPSGSVTVWLVSESKGQAAQRAIVSNKNPWSTFPGLARKLDYSTT